MCFRGVDPSFLFDRFDWFWFSPPTVGGTENSGGGTEKPEPGRPNRSRDGATGLPENLRGRGEDKRWERGRTLVSRLCRFNVVLSTPSQLHLNRSSPAVRSNMNDTSPSSYLNILERIQNSELTENTDHVDSGLWRKKPLLFTDISEKGGGG